MASFASDLLMSGLTDLIKFITLQIAERTVIGASRHGTTGNRSFDNQKELEAKIEAVFGNSLSKEMIDLKKFIEEKIQNVKDTIATSTFEQSVFLEMNSLMRGLLAIDYAFLYHIKNPELKERKAEYLRACERHEPYAMVEFLFQQMNQETGGRSLLDCIVLSCSTPIDTAKLELWQEKIKITLLTAMFHRAYYWNLKVNKQHECHIFEQTTLDVSRLQYTASMTLNSYETTVSTQRMNDQLIDSVSKEMDDLRTKNQHINRVLATVVDRFIFHFILDKCGDVSHLQCGSLSEGTCTVLGAEIYGFLRHIESRKSDDDRVNVSEYMSGSLTLDLKKRWPRFVWAALITRRFDFDVSFVSRLSLEQPKVWIQSRGFEYGLSIPRKRMVSSDVQICRTPKLGFIHRYRRKLGVVYSDALVVWVDPTAFSVALEDRLEPFKILLRHLPVASAKCFVEQFLQDIFQVPRSQVRSQVPKVNYS